MRRLLLLVIALLVVAGCAKKMNMYVVGYVDRTKAWGNTNFWGTMDGWIYSDPVLTELTAKINDKEMDVNLPQAAEYLAFFYDPDTIPPAADTDYVFDIKSDVGDASGTVKMPGDFDITSPLYEDSAAVGPVTVTWEASAGADWYMIRMYFNDTLYNNKDTIMYVDSALTVTSPAGFIDNVGWFSVWVEAGKGPKVGPEAAGNVKGAKGFLVATNSRATQAIIGQPTYAAPKNRLIPEKPIDRIKPLLKELSKHDDAAAEMLELMK
jgi:hypothetical protein